MKVFTPPGCDQFRALPEFPDLPFREIIVSPYRFFYRVKGKTVWIVAAWHGAQLPKKRMRHKASNNFQNGC